MIWIASFLGAALLWMSLPPVAWWPLAWVAPISLIHLIRLERLPGKPPYTVLWLAGFCFWMGAFHWLRLPHPATSIGWVAVSFYFGFYFPLFVGLSRVAVHRWRWPVILAAPIVWTGLELARAHILTGMPMANLAHSQYRWTELIQLSDIFGAYGVSFVVMFVAAALGRMIPCQQQRWTFWPLLPAAAMFGIALFYGHFRIQNSPTGNPGPRVALIQGSIDIEMRYNPKMKEQIGKDYSRLSAQAVKNGKVDLIVWPETMFLTGPEFNDSLITCDKDAPRPRQFDGTDTDFRKWLPWAAENSPNHMSAMAKEFDASLLLGVDQTRIGRDGVETMNSAAFVAKDGRFNGLYSKMHLVMFGEYVPLGKRFPWLQNLTPLPISVTAGEGPEAFDLGNCRVAPNICYETVMPHLIRWQVNKLTAEGREPDILINLTNDGWFWGSSELDLHLACNVFRAVECRKPLLVAANTGFSAWIDGNGRILDQGPRRAEAVIVAQPQIDRRQSWYLAFGDWFSGLCLVFCGLCGLVGFWDRRKAKRASKSPVPSSSEPVSTPK
jgi:apolipoprotein N-acyltransferase